MAKFNEDTVKFKVWYKWFGERGYEYVYANGPYEAEDKFIEKERYKDHPKELLRVETPGTIITRKKESKQDGSSNIGKKMENVVPIGKDEVEQEFISLLPDDIACGYTRTDDGPTVFMSLNPDKYPDDERTVVMYVQGYDATDPALVTRIYMDDSDKRGHWGKMFEFIDNFENPWKQCADYVSSLLLGGVTESKQDEAFQCAYAQIGHDIPDKVIDSIMGELQDLLETYEKDSGGEALDVSCYGDGMDWELYVIAPIGKDKWLLNFLDGLGYAKLQDKWHTRLRDHFEVLPIQHGGIFELTGNGLYKNPYPGTRISDNDESKKSEADYSASRVSKPIADAYSLLDEYFCDEDGHFTDGAVDRVYMVFRNERDLVDMSKSRRVKSHSLAWSALIRQINATLEWDDENPHATSLTSEQVKNWFKLKGRDYKEELKSLVAVIDAYRNKEN